MSSAFLVTSDSYTYAELTKNWTLDLGITLGTTGGVTGIGSVANAATTNSTTATVTLTGASSDTLANGEKASSFVWKKTANDANATGTGATTSSFSAPTEAEAGDYEYYCLITTDVGNVYRTNSVTLAATAAP